MGKKMTKAGMVLRRNIRADIDAEPTIDHLKIRSKYAVGEPLVESAMAKSLAEWDALLAATPDDAVAPRMAARSQPATPSNGDPVQPASASQVVMPGLEQGFVKFARKPAKMGEDYIFWIPRVYLRNGLVDPHAEYEVYLKKR